MTVKTPKPENDSSEDTVIGFKGSEQHHDLKTNRVSRVTQTMLLVKKATDEKLKGAVDGADGGGAVSDALKDAVKK